MSSYVDSIKKLNSAVNEFKSKFPLEETERDCEKGRIAIGHLTILLEDTRKKAIGSRYYSDVARNLEDFLNEHKWYYSFGNCYNYEKKKTFDLTNELITEESKDYEQEVSKQTEQTNKTVLYIGVVIMLIGGFIILKKS